MGLKRIKLAKGKYALVDDKDFELVSQHGWYLNTNGYARTSDPKLYMHQMINKTPAGSVTDHINRDKLDNRRSNLRSVGVIDNSRNRGLSKLNTSGFRGVSWTKTNKWEVYIWLRNKKIHIGRFSDINKAIKARKEAEGVYYAS